MSMFETFKASIFGQESGNGSVDTSKPNYAGARGKGQILEGTFKGLQRAGKIPADYQWAVPEHNEAAAVAYMQEAWDATGGKPDLAAAYYYGGPKAVKDGQIVPYRDKLNPKAPDTVRYAQEIVQRMGLQTATAAVSRAAQTEASIQAGLPRPTDRAAVDRGLQADTAAQVASQQARPDMLTMFGAGMAGNLDNRAAREITEMLFGPKYQPVGGYKPDMTLLPEGADSDLITEVGTAKSPEQAAAAIAEFEEERTRTRVLMDRGIGTGLAMGMLGEVASVSNFVAPLGAARIMRMAGRGSLVAAEAGQTGRAISAGIAESALSGTVLEAAVQGLEGKFRPFDLAVSAVADGLIGGSLGALAGRSASIAQAEKLLNDAHVSAVDNEVRLATLAEAKAGAGASPQEVTRVMETIRADEIKAAVMPSATGSKLLDPEDGVYARGTEARPTEARLQREAPDTPAFREWFGDSKAVDGAGKPVVVYHGTTANFEAFSKEALGSNTGATSAREGFFFAADPATANAYVRQADDTAPQVVPAYLSMQNPKVYDMGGTAERKRSYASLLRQAKQERRDGLIIKGTTDGGPLDTIYVVFDPIQIKSAVGNTGDFSPRDPRIAFSGAVDDKFNIDAVVPKTVFRGNERVVVIGEVTMSKDVKDAVQAIRDMAKLLPSGVRVAVGAMQHPTVRGAALSEQGTVRVALSEIGNAGGRGVETAMHEMTHAITDFYLPNATRAQKDALLTSFGEYMRKAQAGDPEAVLMRWADRLRSDKGRTGVIDTSDKYEVDFGEWLAEQGVRYFRQDAAGANKTGFSQSIVDKMVEWAVSIYRWFTGAKEREYLAPDKAFADFMDDVVAGRIAAADTPQSTIQYSQKAAPDEVVNELQADPVALRLGLNLANVATPADRAKAQAILALHKKAIEWDKANPMDDAYLKRAKNLADNNVFNVASNGLVMLKSPSPLVRMIASELLEDASGVLGKRKATAAIAKYQMERMMLGNVIPDVQNAYKFWQGKNGAAGYYDDLVGGKDWAQFNRLVAEEIEGRRTGATPTSDKNVQAAADVLQAAYQRIANEQRRVGTLGSEGLPLTSKGYMPHRMNAKAVLNMSNAKKQVLHQALTDQFITIEGWDATFSDMLASKYLARVQARAAGDYGSAIAGGNTSTASLVEEALRGMDLPADVVAKHMEKFNKGAANFTKGRTELDLNRVYSTPEGDFKLLDIFDTDQLALVRSQAGRASGEVALTQFGVRGKPGLQLLRDAMQFGEDGRKVGQPEREAFDQMAAEFLNEPLNEKVAQGKWMERAMSANVLVRLGGVGFNQLSETINGVAHIGVAASAKSIASIGRLRSEILALSRGQKVDNPFLTSIEHTGGAEFGTDAYKVVMPFDSPDHLYPTYGGDTPGLLDRLLRGGVHAQAMLSGWRMIHSAQQRGMAEQIVKKIARYVKEGKDDIALDQFGIAADMRTALRRDIDKVSQFDAQGNPLGFDVTKITDPDVQQRLIQAVHRGTSQIIQGTFIGERGKWAHEGWLKLLTQFRTFSITSMEKQWGRQRNSRGDFAAFGLLMGSMSMAWPIYMARVYANSIGREDQEEYIAQRSSIQHVVRATMNYTAMAGMAGDAIDLLTAVLPDGMGVTPTGGRAGQDSTFVGNYIAPSLSLVDDVWKFQQGILDPDRDSFAEAAKLLPGSRIPYLLPFVNALKE